MSATNPALRLGWTSEPAVPGTMSEAYDGQPMSLVRLLREGLLAAIVAFALSAPASVALGGSHAVRQAIIIQGFIILMAGMLFARTLAGRVFLALAYLFFYEYHYFEPVWIWLINLVPSTFMVVAAIVLESLRRKQPALLTVGANHLRVPLFALTAVLFAGVLSAAGFSAEGLLTGLRGALANYVPIMLFAAAGAMVLRRGEAGILLDLFPFLAMFVAITVWIYSLTGARVLFYEDMFQYREVWARFGGLLRNPNNAAFMCAASTLLILCRLHRAPPYLKVILFANAVFLSATIPVLRTRGALMVLVLLLLCLVLIRRTRKAALLFIAIAAVGAVFGGSLLSSSQAEGEASANIIERLRETPEGASVRMQVVLDALGVITRHPFGTGVVGSVAATDVEAVVGEGTHNEYVDFVVKNGFQSLLPLVMLMAVIAGGWVHASRHQLPHRPGTALKVLMAAFLITFTFEPIQNNSHQLGGMFGLVLGMVVASILFAYPQATSGPAMPGPAGPASPRGTLPGDLVWWPAPARAEERGRP